MPDPTEPAPSGYSYLSGADGSYLTGADGAFLLGISMGAQYRLLRPHYLGTVWTPPDAIINEGVNMPNGWVPSLAVDPLNDAAVSAFYAAGPRDNSYGSLNQWPGVANAAPVTYWKQVGYLPSFWKLFGLGSNLPLIPTTDPIPIGSLTDETGSALLDQNLNAITE